MPEGTVSFDVRAPIDVVWSFLSDMRQVGRCVPGVEKVELVDGNQAVWDLRVRIGPLSQTMRIVTRTLDGVPSRHGRFHGEADNLDMTGTIDLSPAPDGTKVVYTLSVTAKGRLAHLLNNFMRTRLEAQTEEFAANVKKALER